MQSSTSSNAPKRSFSFRDAFAALQYPNFQYWVRGQVAAMMGNWMQQTAQGILIFELTKSPAYLGYLSFAMGLPVWLFTLYAGVLSDRVSGRDLSLAPPSLANGLNFPESDRRYGKNSGVPQVTLRAAAAAQHVGAEGTKCKCAKGGCTTQKCPCVRAKLRCGRHCRCSKRGHNCANYNESD